MLYVPIQILYVRYGPTATRYKVRSFESTVIICHSDSPRDVVPPGSAQCSTMRASAADCSVPRLSPAANDDGNHGRPGALADSRHERTSCEAARAHARARARRRSARRALGGPACASLQRSPAPYRSLRAQTPASILRTATCAARSFPGSMARQVRRELSCTWDGIINVTPRRARRDHPE